MRLVHLTTVAFLTVAMLALSACAVVVFKDFDDGNTGSVHVFLNCLNASGTPIPVTPVTEFASEATPALFESDVLAAPGSSCRAIESPVPPGYTVDDSNCRHIDEKDRLSVDDASDDDSDDSGPFVVGCTLYNNSAKIEVRKVLFPGSDSGRFNLQVDGVTKKSNAGNGATTGEVGVRGGVSHTVRETAYTGSTVLSRYNSSITCKDNNGTGSVVAATLGSGPLTLTPAPHADIVCIIQNFRKPGT